MDINTKVMRGEIYYIGKGNYTGSEQEAGRPAIIVSNNVNNSNSHIVEIVYLTLQPKNNLPTHVRCSSSDTTTGTILGTILCEQIHTVDKSRLLNDYCECRATDELMDKVDKAIAISLDLVCDTTESETGKTALPLIVPSDNTLKKQYNIILSQLKSERDFYKEQYEKMLEQLVDMQ